MAKVIQSKRLHRLEGVTDITFGKASVEARRQRDFSKDGQAVKAAESDDEYDDVKAQQKQFGLTTY